MCSISGAALLGTLPEHPKPSTASETEQPIVRSVLVHDLGLSEQAQLDAYLATMAASFYSGLCGLGASTVALAWSCVTPSGCTRQFVIRNGGLLTAVPFCSCFAVALNAVALCLAVDTSRGKPVSCVAMEGTLWRRAHWRLVRLGVHWSTIWRWQRSVGFNSRRE
jgi:hypothetical protein